jgi:hypothetical protein
MRSILSKLVADIPIDSPHSPSMSEIEKSLQVIIQVARLPETRFVNNTVDVFKDFGYLMMYSLKKQSITLGCKTPQDYLSNSLLIQKLSDMSHFNSLALQMIKKDGDCIDEKVVEMWKKGLDTCVQHNMH